MATDASRSRAAENEVVQTLVPGSECPAMVPAFGRAMKVWLPSNYAADRAWPVVFFYPGQGGSPDTTFLRNLTDGRDYIVVGMPHVAGDKQPENAREQEALRATELQGLRNARIWLAAHATIDETAVFLAGVSKGGWTASMLWERELPKLAGLVILLAGRLPGPEAPSTALVGKPVYIGVGETDPNHLPAVRARHFFRRRGAKVSFDVYEGVGHEVPHDLPRLRVWLQAFGPLRSATSAAEQTVAAKAAISAEIQAALAETDVLAQFRHFQALGEDPRLALCEPPSLAPLSKRLAELRQTSPAMEEGLADACLDSVLTLEDGLRTLADMKAVRDGYESLVQRYPRTRAGMLAAAYLPALETAYRKSVEASQKAAVVAPAGPPRTVTPVFPSSGSERGAYPVPVRRGNKITFGRPSAEN